MSRPDLPATEGFRLTVLGTTDTHGHILNWDYYTDAEYDDARHNDVGLAKISTLVNTMRAERGWCATLTLDAGDTIQGTPLAYYYARIDPITGAAAPIHPMAAAMNAIGFDAAALGNHEFNYGIETLRGFQSQLRHPLLGANALDWDTGEPVFDEFIIKDVPVGDHRGHQRGHRHDEHGEFVRIGIVGLVTPGCAIWDKASLEGRIRFNGIVEQARLVIPKVQQAGADVVIVCCHSGTDTSSSYGDALPWPENASTLLAQEVPGIDAILVGHAHQEIGQRFVPNTATGKQVLLSEPLRFGHRLTVMDLDLVSHRGRWQVGSASARVLNTSLVDADDTIVSLVLEQHEKVRGYVNSVIGACTFAMSAAASRYQHTAAMDFLNHVQGVAVKQALAGSPSASLPVLSIVSPFNAAAAIPAGEVTVRDVAGLYIFDNTLLGIAFTGAQVRQYLEYSAAYFKQVSGTGPFSPMQLIRAVTSRAPKGTSDHNYDIMSGLDAPLTYDIDIAREVGSRIRNLHYGGSPVTDEQRFVLAINNYRQSGGGNFPAVTTAPVLYDAQVEVRQLIIDWVSAAGVIDPAVFSDVDWRLVSDGQPIRITAESTR
ncbi:MAG TPA: 5'-nucleotidase C-terminal domain-containing protein [Jatrophihabitans sp.]|jgi:2',3'-cyclic-nucleotide 2'-phosphodiesterase/3'-nucleotidase|uniref:bifunctional metallophosphatase/5'-nucleotidase n=1 Tax=Jatrophihabitans sp. TaxID=1932789 RepID=UPI002EE69ED7